jgi:tetratricopeptide (TPR) repeat protein
VAAKTWSNLAATLCKLSYFEDALMAAEQGTICDPQWGKAWWRHGVVLSLVREFASAASAYERACELEPSNGTFVQAARDTRKMLGIAEEPNESGLRELSADEAAGTRWGSSADIEAGPMVAWKTATGYAAGGLLGWMEESRRVVGRFLGGKPGALLDPSQVSAEELIGVCTSETWIVEGLLEWVRGLQGGLVQLIMAGCATTQAGRDTVAAYRPQATGHSPEERKQIEARLFGGFSGDAVPQLFCGWVTLAGGGMIWLEMGTVASQRAIAEGGRQQGGGRGGGNILLAPHPMLEGFRQEQAQQMLAITVSIANLHMTLQQTFGPAVLVPQAVLMAVDTVKANLGSGPAKTSTKAVTVEAALHYLRKQLQSGISWDGGCRQLVSCWFRCSVLMAQFIRLQGMRGEAYKLLAWALEMIEAVDEEYQVTTKRRFDECGSAFMPSIRRSVLQGVDAAHRDLRGQSFTLTKGPFPIGKEVQLKMKMIRSATEHPPRDFNLTRLQDDAIYRRKPLTYAHGGLASLLGRMPGFIEMVPDEADADMPPNFEIGGESFFKFMVENKLLHGHHDPRNLYAVIAEHYRLAAENQLMDADDAAILWFGYAANMVRADATKGSWVPSDGAKENTDGYTLGDLRYAIRQARKAAAARAVSIWGEDLTTGGSYEGQAEAVCEFFAREADSFLLPEVHVEGTSAGNTQLVFHEGEPGNKTGPDVVICADFERFMARDMTEKDRARGAGWLKQPDDDDDADADAGWTKKQRATTEAVRRLEEAHGVDRSVGPPPLAVLCVRAVHRAGYEFAAGAADPHEVATRLMALVERESM